MLHTSYYLLKITLTKNSAEGFLKCDTKELMVFQNYNRLDNDAFVTMHFKKIKSACQICQRNLNIFFQSAFILAIRVLTHFEKKIRKSNFSWLPFFLFSKTIINVENESSSPNDKCFINDSINNTFICQGCEVIPLG